MTDADEKSSLPDGAPHRAIAILSAGYRPLGSRPRAAGWSAATSCHGPLRTRACATACPKLAKADAAFFSSSAILSTRLPRVRITSACSWRTDAAEGGTGVHARRGGGGIAARNPKTVEHT